MYLFCHDPTFRVFLCLERADQRCWDLNNTLSSFVYVSSYSIFAVVLQCLYIFSMCTSLRRRFHHNSKYYLSTYPARVSGRIFFCPSGIIRAKMDGRTARVIDLDNAFFG